MWVDKVTVRGEGWVDKVTVRGEGVGRQGYCEG